MRLGFCYLDIITLTHTQASVTEVVCAATVGGMLPYFSDGLYMFETLDDDLKGYTVIGFLGAMVSLIAIVST